MYADQALQVQRDRTVRKVRQGIDSLARFLMRRGLLSDSQYLALCDTRSLALFNPLIRNLLVTHLTGSSDAAKVVNSQAFWHAIDACSFVEDATPGRWPYNGVSDWKRSLDWAAQRCDELLGELARASRPAVHA